MREGEMGSSDRDGPPQQNIANGTKLQVKFSEDSDILEQFYGDFMVCDQ